jgi:hypothetical protein
MYSPGAINDQRHFIGGSEARICKDEKALIQPGEIGPEDLSGDLVAKCSVLRQSRPGGTDGIRWSGLLSFSEPNAGAPTVFLDERDAGGLNRLLELCTRLIRDARSEPSLQALNGRDGQTSSQGEFALRPS